MIYHVWYADGIYWGSFSLADNAENAIAMAKKIGVIAPMVQDDASFIALHAIKDDNTKHYALNQQKLRFADIKSTENRTWRDRSYVQ